jgi:hypothetical protein
MKEFKGTKGKWKAFNQGPHWNNPVIDNWEIHWSEDGECVVDHVYDKYDALLISKAPEMLEMLDELYNDLKQGALPSQDELDQIKQLIKEATEL